jgi:hypothetical protein
MAAFIFVHGTFAKSAHWPALQAGLAAAAEAAGERAYFQEALWSGKNRATAREKAATDILSVMEKIKSPSNEKLFIIGHSHGGSAIAYFLKNYPTAAKWALRNAPRPRSVNTSVIAGPAASPSQKDAG